ncbi:MAG: anaerobic ribonucleoside-triphosphate reductase activating protein [Nanoarchaeota archaeon]|nr:anaerobic ribonucleoside-triphosphate reductase activating protein [Nanoarchaeota archaeon]
MSIRGLEKFTTLDYLGKDSAVVFFSGCNFSCPYCQNPDLVGNDLPDLNEEEVIQFLERRKKWLDAVVISGGEPTLDPNLPGFLNRVRSLGYATKIFTNGSTPDTLEQLIPLLDSISMDVKGPLDRYPEITQSRIHPENVERSTRIVRDSRLDYEFRTTILPDLIVKEDLLKIANWLKGSQRYILQNFNSKVPVLDPSYQEKQGYTKEQMAEFKELLSPYFGVVKTL